MKYSKKIRGMSTALAFAFAFMVFSFSFAPKAHAVEFNGEATWGLYKTSHRAGMAGWQSNTEAFPVTNGYVAGNLNNSGTYIAWGDFGFKTDSTTTFSGIVKLYASYYLVRTNNVSGVAQTDDFMDSSTWEVSYINTYGQTGYVDGGLSSFKTFTPAVSGVESGYGYAIEAVWTADSVYPIKTLAVNRAFGTGFYATAASSMVLAVAINAPSIRLITTEYSAEMEALDNVASEIAAQSDILLAMKGDLVAILQDIYTMTGDMHIAQNLLNGYIEQLLPLIQNIDQTTTNIYALLSSQLAALETAINTSASTIEAAIEAQTAAMIAYLEEMFNTGNEVPDETYEQQQDAENILDQMESLEKPDVETIVPDIGDIGNDDISGALSSIFSSNLIVTMMTLSASLAFGAYVLFGKRG